MRGVRLLPSRTQFERLSEGATHVPVWGEILADRDTPVSAFRKLCRGRYGCLLESNEGGEKWARYSFVVPEPVAILRAHGTRVEMTRNDGTKTLREGADPLRVVREVLAEYRVPAVPGLPRFTGGLVGYIAYDAVRWIERLPKAPADDLGLPDLLLLLVETLVVFDSHEQKVLILTHAPVGTTASTSAAYDIAQERIDRIAAALDEPARPLDVRFAPGTKVEADSTMSPVQFMEAVKAAKEYIAAGDIIQVVLAQRFSRRSSVRPFDLYRCLRSINPSPYLYYLELDDFSVVGASPEVMVRLEDGRMTVRPIAGTRPRAATSAEDERLARALLADPKERAEHLMLLDLGRNDVGRVALPGTVRVTEQFVIERYSHVMHLVSNVEGGVAPEFDAIDALRAAFPAGTLSGAPKVRAMEIIDELEPTRRGVYGGAIGYFDFAGSMDTCITIRTAVVKDGVVHVQAGAGIVWDSDPQSEHEECVRKAQAMMTALDMAETLGDPAATSS